MSNFNHLKLAGAIAESGKTQNELAEAIGVHYNTISAWATNKAAPTPMKLYWLLCAIGWDIDRLAEQRLVDWYSVNGN